MNGNHPPGPSSQDLDRPAEATGRKRYLSPEKLARFPVPVIKFLSFASSFSILLLPWTALAQPLEIVVVGRDTCRALAAHHPAPGVAYTPGVDVHGRPVAPADLPSAAAGTGEVKVALKRGLPIGSGALGASEIVVGEVKIDLLTGRATLDGKPLEAGLQSDVLAACGRP